MRRRSSCCGVSGGARRCTCTGCSEAVLPSSIHSPSKLICKGSRLASGTRYTRHSCREAAQRGTVRQAPVAMAAGLPGPQASLTQHGSNRAARAAWPALLPHKGAPRTHCLPSFSASASPGYSVYQGTSW